MGNPGCGPDAPRTTVSTVQRGWPVQSAADRVELGDGQVSSRDILLASGSVSLLGIHKHAP